MTKDLVSIHNDGDGNWGGILGGDIHQIKMIPDVSSPVQVVASGETKTTSTLSPAPSESNVVVRVPEDCSTLTDAVKKVHGDSCLTTIVVGPGEHKVGCLVVPSAMNILGDPDVPKEKIGTVLFARRKDLHTPFTQRTLGFLYARFRKGSEAWDVHESFRRLILTGLLIYFSPSVRANSSLL